MYVSTIIDKGNIKKIKHHVYRVNQKAGHSWMPENCPGMICPYVVVPIFSKSQLCFPCMQCNHVKSRVINYV